MKILKTPWKNELMDLVAQSKKSIKITSPFVKENVCMELLSKMSKDIYSGCNYKTSGTIVN
jgi:hypothetical protein